MNKVLRYQRPGGKEFVEAADYDAAERDAKRYRWLRNNPAWESEAFLSDLSPDEFDAAVDAAIAADRETDGDSGDNL